MKTYTLIAGVNGTGKSSMSGVLQTQRGDLGLIVDVDKIAVEHNCGAYAAGKLAVSRMREALARGESFTQETTLSGERTKRFAREAKEKGYFIRLFYIGLNSAEESVKRIENRVAKGGHGIDRIDVSRRFAKRFEDLLKVLPYCDEAEFYNNENGFEIAGEYREGKIIRRNGSAPEWLTALEKALTAPPQPPAPVGRDDPGTPP
ncbi:MAG: hypothetical protein LBR76_08600 [Oscillospiraceae bacterium]|nr:hypothetical protein [Oscillospiraceae bacterium]